MHVLSVEKKVTRVFVKLQAIKGAGGVLYGLKGPKSRHASGAGTALCQRLPIRRRTAAKKVVDPANCRTVVYPAQEKPEGALLAHLPTPALPMKLTQLTCFLTFGLLQQGQVISSLSPAKTSFSNVLPQASQQYS